MSFFRRFVNLVLRDNPHVCEYSIRNIDMLRLFPATTTTMLEQQPSSSSTQQLPPAPTTVNLPPPALLVRPTYIPHGEVAMDFMLFDGDKVLATDQTGSSLLYDPIDHVVRAMPTFTTSKHRSISVTVGDSDLYVMNTGPNWPENPNPVFHNHNFEALVAQREGFVCRPLPPTPGRFQDFDPCHGVIRSYTVGRDGYCIWITKERMGTFSYNTSTWLWRKLGDWALPFVGRGVHVPELHDLWFGLTSCGSGAGDADDSDTTNLLCAVDVEARPMPVVRATWEHLVPPKELGWSPVSSYLIHLGLGRFCICRVYRSLKAPYQFMVFAGVELEPCGDGDEEGDVALQMVKHNSEVYVLPSSMPYWVL